MSARVASIDASYFVDTCALAVLLARPATTPKAMTVAIETPANLCPSVFLSSLPFLSIGTLNDGKLRVSSPWLSAHPQWSSLRSVLEARVPVGAAALGREVEHVPQR